MNEGNPHNPLPKERLDDNDPVWCLIAQAPRPEPDAWFAARTMARCRNENLGIGDHHAAGAFSRIWRWALGGGLAVCMAVILMAQNQAPPAQPDQQQNVQEAFEVVASMNTNPDSSPSSSSWQDSSL
jgi:hypothetical protein